MFRITIAVLFTMLVFFGLVSTGKRTHDHKYRTATEWRDPQSGIGSAVYSVDQFLLSEDEDPEPQTATPSDTGYTIVNCLAAIDDSPRHQMSARPLGPWQLRLAI